MCRNRCDPRQTTLCNDPENLTHIFPSLKSKILSLPICILWLLWEAPTEVSRPHSPHWSSTWGASQHRPPHPHHPPAETVPRGWSAQEDGHAAQSAQFWSLKAAIMWHANPGTFIHEDLTNCTHVFLRQDSTCRALQPPYTGPYQVLSRKDRTLKLLVRGKPITVSAERVKPAYIFNEDESGHTISQHADTATPTKAPPDIPTPPSAIKTTDFGWHVHLPVCFTS
jgi:hypothetical protein